MPKLEYPLPTKIPELDRWLENLWVAYNTPKMKLTAIGGMAVSLTNKSGAVSVKGEGVEVDTVTDNAVNLTETSDAFCIGFFLDANVQDGEEAWIVVSGIAVVKADAGGFSKGDRLTTSSATAGRVQINNSPSTAVHFTEIGHALEDAAANATGKAAIHFL